MNDNNLTTLMIQGMMAKMSEDRRASAENLRLGQFIEALEKCDQSLPVVLDKGGGVGDFVSYRGYYEDLCITPCAEPITVGRLLAHARDCVGSKFEGYKGGDFWMTKNSLLWVAPSGSCGEKLIAVRPEALRVVIETAEDAL
jgi:hypothetical protein